MTQFYSPKSQTVMVAGQRVRVTRGIHEVPDVLANSSMANDLGIKPVEEMTADEYRALGLVPPPPPAAHKTAPAKAEEPPVQRTSPVEMKASFAEH